MPSDVLMKNGYTYFKLHTEPSELAMKLTDVNLRIAGLQAELL